jgi:hypothetical protein
MSSFVIPPVYGHRGQKGNKLFLPAIAGCLRTNAECWQTIGKFLREPGASLREFSIRLQESGKFRQEIAARLQEFSKFLQEIGVRLQEFSARRQSFGERLRSFPVRRQSFARRRQSPGERLLSFGKRLQERVRSDEAFGPGINENWLIYRDLSINWSKIASFRSSRRKEAQTSPAGIK